MSEVDIGREAAGGPEMSVCGRLGNSAHRGGGKRIWGGRPLIEPRPAAATAALWPVPGVDWPAGGFGGALPHRAAGGSVGVWITVLNSAQRRPYGWAWPGSRGNTGHLGACCAGRVGKDRQLVGQARVGEDLHQIAAAHSAREDAGDRHDI